MWLVYLGCFAALFYYFFARRVTNTKLPDERICVVTGASGGIGAETVLLLERLGWRVLATDIDAKGLEELDKKTSHRVEVLAANLCEAAGCELVREKAEAAAAKIGAKGVHALVNCAGAAQQGPSAEIEDGARDSIFAINVGSVLRLTRLMMPCLLKSSDPRLCNISSVAGLTAWPWAGLYPATKFAVDGWSDAIRRESLANGLPLRVSVVNPGFVHTKMALTMLEKRLDWTAKHPESPFSPAMKVATERAIYLQGVCKKFGYFDAAAWMGCTPDYVAEDIAHAIGSPSPRYRYVSASAMFKVLLFLVRVLPYSLGDRLLLASC